MFSMRRAAQRLLSTPLTTSVQKPRSIQTLIRSSVKPIKHTPFVLAQQRWASDQAPATKDDAPISKLQPTPLEEVENAVREDADGESTVAEDQQLREPGRTSAASTTVDTDSSNHHPSAEVRRIQAEQDRKFAPKPTVYIGNLFFDVTEDDLTKEFSTLGTVIRCRIIRDARGLSKGFGYVTFATTEQATSAIDAMNQQLFEGRRLSLQYATHEDPPSISSSKGGPRNPPSKTLFIGNMSWEMTDRDLNDLFRGVRNVIDVRVAIDRRTGQPRGFAHADFIDIKSALEARKLLDNKEIYGRKLRLDFSYSSSAATRNQARDEGEQKPTAQEPKNE